jgi:LysM repeat protein
VQSYELMYDAVGQVVGRFINSGPNQIVYRTTYDLRGRKQYEFHAEYLNPVNFEFGGISRQYTYDAADRMTETRSFYQNGTSKNAPLDGEGFPQGPDMSIAGWISSAETYTYDADGRLTLQINLERNNGINGIQWFEPWEYDDTLQRTSLSVLVEDSRVMYTDQFGNSGYDSVGRVSVYRYTAKDISWATHTYTSTYEGWEGYVEKFISGVSTNNNYRATTNTLTYDAFGKLIKQIENTPLPSNLGVLEDRARAYTYNGDGRVQTRREGKIVSGAFTQTPDASGANPNYLFVHAAGQQQAELREGGQIRYNGGYTYNTQQIQTLNGSGNYAAGGGTVTAQQGETLQSLAQRVYGNSSLWYVLADANGLSDPDAGLIAGTQLNTPKVTVSNNDANTFRPYDPSEAIGPTSPGLPYITPPPKKSCNVIAMVLMVVVAVVVTVFTAGAAAMAMGVVSTASGATGIMAIGGAALTGGLAGAGVAAGSMLAVAGATTIAAGSAAAIGGAVAAGFVGGFMGSVASQVVGKALGVVDHFSLRSAFASGLTAGLTAGTGAAGVVGKIAGSSTVAQGAVRGALGAVSSYAANRVAGIDVSFSWRSIAAAAVSGAISSAVTPKIVSGLGIESKFGTEFASRTIDGAVNLHVRRAFGFDDKVDYGHIIADAFGNALGNAIVDKAIAVSGRRAAIEQIANASDAKQGTVFANIQSIARNDNLSYAERQRMIVEMVRGTSTSDVIQEVAANVQEGEESLTSLAVYDGDEPIMMRAGGAADVVAQEQGTINAARQGIIDALDGFAMRFSESERIRGQVFADESTLNQTLIVIGAGLNSVWEGIKGTASLLWDAASASQRAQMYVGRVIVGVAQDLVTGNTNGLRERLREQVDRVQQFAETADARVKSQIEGLRSFAEIMGDRDVRQAFVRTARSIVENVSTPTLLFAAAGIIGEVLFSIGTAGAGTAMRAIRAGGGAVNVLTGAGRTARSLTRIADEFPDAAAALRAIGIYASEYRSAREIISYVGRAQRMGVPDSFLREAAEFSRRTGPIDERSGLFYGYVRMRNAGWQYGDVAKYGSNNGLDGIFWRLNRQTGQREFAVLEAKSAGNASGLATAGGHRQGTMGYIVDRLQRASAASRDPAQRAAYAEMLSAIPMGRVQSYASFANSDRLVRLPPSWSGGAVGSRNNVQWVPPGI